MFIRVSNIQKSFDENMLFRSGQIMLSSKHIYGLVGKNGSGKSTFLKIICREIRPDKGSVVFDPAYLTSLYNSQTIDIDKLSLEMDEVKSYLNIEVNIFHYLLFQKKDLFDLWRKIQVNQEVDHVSIYSESGGYDFESRIYQECKRINLDPDQTILSLSGGQKTRVQIAKLKLIKSDILLLDEPTNHLDQEGLEYFYEFITKYEGIIIIASHDRNLLDKYANKILEIENCKVNEYSGNYSQYFKQKLQERVGAEERYRQNEKKVEKLNESASKLSSRIEKHIEHKRKFNLAVERTARLSKKNKRLKSKIIQTKLKLYRDNDKMQAKNLIDRQRKKLGANRGNVLNRARNISSKNNAPKIGWSLKLDFQTTPIESNYAINIKNLSCGYPDKVLIQNLDLDLKPNQKKAVIGPNGIGKSTLLKTIAGILPPHSGEIIQSTQIHLGYLEQENLNLDQNARVIDEFIKDAGNMEESQARAFLHFFLFEDQMPFRPVKFLSEGEKVKLKLAKLLYSKANVLLLDEPTNHLDIPSQEVIEKALKDFAGAIIIVSHDKVLLKNLGIENDSLVELSNKE